MATAKANELTSVQAWQDRAVALAEARNLTGTARLERADATSARYLVPSGDRRGEYVVGTRIGDKPHCSCRAGEWGQPCSHAGAVIHAERQRAAALAINESAFASFNRNLGY